MLPMCGGCIQLLEDTTKLDHLIITKQAHSVLRKSKRME